MGVAVALLPARVRAWYREEWLADVDGADHLHMAPSAVALPDRAARGRGQGEVVSAPAGR